MICAKINALNVGIGFQMALNLKLLTTEDIAQLILLHKFVEITKILYKTHSAAVLAKILHNCMFQSCPCVSDLLLNIYFSSV